MAEFLTHNIAHSDAEKRKSFWSRHLYGAKSTLIQPENATAFNEPRVEIFRPSFLDAAAVQRLEADARHQGVSTQAVFLAAHARTYARLTQGSDAVFGIYLANRSFSLEGVSTFLAPTLNLVPLRVVDTSRPLLAIARSIIEDLQAIGSVQNACVSLAEVAAWTGVRVNCFVNFLKLPAAIAENLKGHTLLQQAGGEKWAVDRSEVNPVGSSTGIPPHLKKIINPRGAYLPAVDIEATISPTTGALSVGVFGPANLLGLEEAEALLADLRTEIEAAFPA
ncbi:MAG: hypothetical protein M1832_003388 [Thelocarpon impressellum]|nr:MAG: hypothetical protein M1832_003388 [Thelocarpon impressellum]